MTCIAGVVCDDGSVVIGGDSAGVSNLDIRVRKDPKVFRNGEFLIGFAGSFRARDIVQYVFIPPPISDDIDRYMRTAFIDSLRVTLTAAGQMGKQNEIEGSTAQFLVGVRGRLYSIFTDLQVGESARGYDAVGCGEDFANGVLFATRSYTDGNAEARIHWALEAAVEHSGGVRPPFTIRRLEPWTG